MLDRKMNRRRAFAGFAAITGVTATAAEARQPEAKPILATERGTITVAGATALVAAAIAKAAEIGINVAVAVVDESGILKAFARMDGAGPATVDIVPRKAYTAAAFRTSTQAFAQRNQDQLTQAISFAELPRVTLLPGGVPILSGRTVIGGLGVGGGTGDQDVAIAEAAIAAVA